MKHTGLDKDYRRLHHWVERQLGKPTVCSNCTTTTAKRYDWANVSSQYKQDISDWIRLCRACHNKMDMKRNVKNKGYRRFGRCKRNHLVTGDNTYISPTDGKSYCLDCKKMLRHQYYLRRKTA